MRKYLLLIVVAVALAAKVKAQECYHTSLSKQFAFKVTATRISEEENSLRFSATVVITIVDQTTNQQVQQIYINADELFGNAYSNCEAVRSYTTGLNANSTVSDNEYGDLIVVDLNFDGREDLAIKYDSGGNGGPAYSYFLQQVDRSFEKDTFLTEQMIYFPTEIDNRRKRLVNYVHANAKGEDMNVYAYDSKKKEWRFVKRRFKRG